MKTVKPQRGTIELTTHQRDAQGVPTGRKNTVIVCDGQELAKQWELSQARNYNATK